MTTEQVIRLTATGPADWKPAPAPKEGPFFARTAPNSKPVMHADNWLVAAIHGPNYEWAYPNSRLT